MNVVTKYRLAVEIKKILSSGETSTASGPSHGEVYAAIGQVINQLLKIDYLSVNLKMGEAIPNGSVVGTYDGIAVSMLKGGKSKCSLPVKPLKLPRGMGTLEVYRTNFPDDPFIPLQMGVPGLLKSQPLINDLLGQVGYQENGMTLVFTKDLTILYPGETVSMKLVLMDITQYDEYDSLPILPEMEWQVKDEVIKMFGGRIAEKLVDPSVKEQENTPVRQQRQ